MSLFASYISLYCFGLVFLIVSLAIGRLLLNRKGLLDSEHLIIGYSLIIAIYAIIKTEGLTIAWLILLWIGIYKYWSQKEDIDSNPEPDKISNNLFVIWILWSAVFVLKVLYFWNFEYYSPNLHFKDYPFYMKLAEGFNLYGSENGMGHLNLFLSDNKFLQPYRSNDLWLTSFGLDFTKFDTVFIWELFYGPVLLTLVAYTLFKTLELSPFKARSHIIVVLALFLFAGGWYRSLINLIGPSSLSGSLDPIGIVSYPKLCLVFVICFVFYHRLSKGLTKSALFWLVLTPVFVQSALAIFPITLLLSLIYFINKREKIISMPKKLSQFFFILLLMTFSFVITYLFSSSIEKNRFEFMVSDIVNFIDLADLMIGFIKKMILFFISYYWLSLILVGSLLLFLKRSNLKWKFAAYILISFLVSMATFSFFKNVGDAYQFSTNVLMPFLISLIIFLFLSSDKFVQYYSLRQILFSVLAVYSFYQVFGQSNAFHSTQKIKRYSPLFIKEMKYELSQLDHEYGVYYNNPNEDVPYKEHFPLAEAAFLKLFGRNYDVFNLNGWRLKEEQFSFEQQKYCVFTARHSINLINENLDKFSFETDVLSIYRKFYPFSYCLSKTPLDQLPLWLSNEISYSVCDERSEVYYYKFKS